MIPTDHQVLLSLQAQYDATLLADGDTIREYHLEGDDMIVIKNSDCVRVLFEGSHDFLNWFFNVQAVMVYPPELKGAGVELGFWRNLLPLLGNIKQLLIDAPLISCEGHSRGAGMADQFAALLRILGYGRIQCVTFGRPNPGDAALAKIHQSIENRSYWNYGDRIYHDPVGDAPPHLIFPFTQTSQRLLVNSAPGKDDRWGPIAGWHHLSPQYDLGLQGFENGKS